MAFNIYSISDDIKHCISKLVDSNPYQLSVKEYSTIAEEVVKSPCNLLIFGVGKDSSLWMNLNAGGLTIFLEDNEGWLALVSQELPNIRAYLIEYNTTRSDWKRLLQNSQELMLDLPDAVINTEWDVIFVDGPAGYADELPGRMRSIYTASRLGKKSPKCSVFVHDCHREVESTYCDTFLQQQNLVFSVDRLRYYILKAFKGLHVF